jgi:hypothetical protein
MSEVNSMDPAAAEVAKAAAEQANRDAMAAAAQRAMNPPDVSGVTAGAPQQIVVDPTPVVASERELVVLHITVPADEVWNVGDVAYRFAEPQKWTRYGGESKLEGEIVNGGPIMHIEGGIAHVVVRGSVHKSAVPLFDKAVKVGAIPKRAEWKDAAPAVLIKAV